MRLFQVNLFFREAKRRCDSITITLSVCLNWLFPISSPFLIPSPGKGITLLFFFARYANDLFSTFDFPGNGSEGMYILMAAEWEGSSFQFTAEDFSFPKFERIQPTLRQIDKPVLLKKKEASSSCYTHKSKISSEPIPQTLFSLFLCVTRVSGIQFINFLYLSLSSPSPPLFPPWDRLQFRVPIF